MKTRWLVVGDGPSRRDWLLLAALGFFVPALLAFIRLCLLRGTIWGVAGFLPLDGPIRGYWPHIFYRIMHNLTQPILLVGYCGFFTCLTFHLRATAHARRHGAVAWFGILLAHLVLFSAYAWSLFLPMGDMVETIRP
jgi:hypothetical protein